MNNTGYQQGRPAGVVGRARMFFLWLVVFLLSAGIAAASEKEKPFALRIGAGIGAAGEIHEQYTPLVCRGMFFRLEGGWALSGEHILWDGQISWDTGSVSSSREQGFEVETNVLNAQTAVFGFLPVNPARTKIGLGLCISASALFTSGLYHYEEDLCDTLFFSSGPAVFIENSLLDPWVFRLRLSLPLVGYSLGPVWANGAGGELDTEWKSVAEHLLFEGNLSAGRRLSKNVEVFILYTCLFIRQEKPFESKLFHNSLGLGAEFDLGGAR